MGLGALTFAFPGILLALLALPILWWLLKLIPPSPRQVTFPPIQFLLSLKETQSSANHTPWWLMALRVLIVALTILALSGPSWHRAAPLEGQGPLLLIVDNSWASSHNWQDRQKALHSFIDEAARQDRPILLVSTVRQASAASVLSFLSPREARHAVDRLDPLPWNPDPLATLDLISPQLNALAEEPYDIVWVSDGLDHGNTQSFASRLTEHGSVRLMQFSLEDGPILLSTPEVFANRFSIKVRRLKSGAPLGGQVYALDIQNKVLAIGDFSFAESDLASEANINLPLELRNKIASLRVAKHASASSAVLLDERWRRRSVGIVAEAQDIEKPLLSDVYYSEKALQPFAEIQKGSLRKLLTLDLSIILMPGQNNLSEEDRRGLKDWVAEGGTLVRFANAQMASDPIDLLPVPLRGGGRALEGALSWGTPQSLGKFQENSPFYGLDIPPDVTVSRQILAEPSLELATKTWAQLEDGTPLVTAAREGQGWLILFHTTASAEWSSLPLSGLYVDMLRRILDLSQSVSPDGQNAANTFQPTLPPILVLDGFGTPKTPGLSHAPISLADGSWMPGPAHPPGLYGTQAQVKAFNLSPELMQAAPLKSLPANIKHIEQAVRPAIALRAPFLVSAFILALIDGLVVLWIAGLLKMSALKPLARSLPALIFVMLVYTPEGALAQTEPNPDTQALQAALETHLAYVKTGDASLDAVSRAGLTGLTQSLRRRTAAEPGAPMAVNIETDELAFYPLIYWPVRAGQPEISPSAAAKLNRYMANGGTLLLDTGDQQQKVLSSQTADSARLKAILEQLHVPPLVQVPRDHVLTKSFYLIQEYPGRWIGGPVWVEAVSAEGQNDLGQHNDGVSSIVIGSNDFAGAWAIDANGRPRLPLVPGGPGQREGAMRFGINLVMYTLTGNYKADQVHVPALLERLGQ
jgi:hypothetical protein